MDMAVAVSERHSMVRKSNGHLLSVQTAVLREFCDLRHSSAIKIRFAEMLDSGKTGNQTVELLLRLIVWGARTVIRVQ